MYIIVAFTKNTGEIALIISKFFLSVDQAEEKIEEYKIIDKSFGWNDKCTYEIYEVRNIKDIIR